MYKTQRHGNIGEFPAKALNWNYTDGYYFLIWSDHKVIHSLKNNTYCTNSIIQKFSIKV